MPPAHKPIDEHWNKLEHAAWEACEHAYVYGNTYVGAAVLSSQGGIFAGCNVEHRFRSHDVHAEVNALTTMVAAGGGDAQAVLIVGSRERFTPCGACLYWIFELGGPQCLVAFQRTRKTALEPLPAEDLMPHYPR